MHTPFSSRTRGFTLIELLVVIAIIGLLAAVVLASVGSARTKGVDAAVKAELDTIRSQVEIYANSHGNKYTNVCSTPSSGDGISGLLAAAATSTGSTVQGTFGNAEVGKQVYCNASNTAWKVQAPLTSGYWCVDSNSITEPVSSPAGAGSFNCP